MKIVVNEKEFLAEFIRLNEEWISHYFDLEEVDHNLARNPGRVIDDGGYIFSILEGEIVVGTCALFFEGEGVYELARMAVSPQHRGKGFGRNLMEACLNKLAEIGAKKVYLVSNTKLESAIALYKSKGFITVFQGKHPVYSRANIVMELALS